MLAAGGPRAQYVWQALVFPSTSREGSCCVTPVASCSLQHTRQDDTVTKVLAKEKRRSLVVFLWIPGTCRDNQHVAISRARCSRKHRKTKAPEFKLIQNNTSYTIEIRGARRELRTRLRPGAGGVQSMRTCACSTTHAFVHIEKRPPASRWLPNGRAATG